MKLVLEKLREREGITATECTKKHKRGKTTTTTAVVAYVDYDDGDEDDIVFVGPRSGNQEKHWHHLAPCYVDLAFYKPAA